MLYEPGDVDHARISQAKIFHFGSISLIDEPSRSATMAALVTAKTNDVLVSYDPNLRCRCGLMPILPGKGSCLFGIVLM
jgi:fructokinase